MGDGEDGPVAFMDQGWGTGGEGRLVVPLFRTDGQNSALGGRRSENIFFQLVKN